jgi:hypothetical protein
MLLAIKRNPAGGGISFVLSAEKGRSRGFRGKELYQFQLNGTVIVNNKYPNIPLSQYPYYHVENGIIFQPAVWKLSGKKIRRPLLSQKLF